MVFADPDTKNTMNTRSTHNSQSAAYDASSLVQESEEIPPESAPSASSVASTAPSSTSVVSPTSPVFLAAVTNAIQQVLSAQQVASISAWSVPTSMANYGGPFAPPANNSSQLAAQASLFAASGAGFASSVLARGTPSASGRPNNCVVPTFVSIARTLGSSQQSQRGSSLKRCIISSVAGSTVRGGPWFFSCPAKLVSQIKVGKFVELHELLPSNIFPSEPEPQLLFNGRLVLTSPPKRPKRRIEDIATWLEAFSIYCLILLSYFSHHWKDLLQYQVLIL